MLRCNMFENEEGYDNKVDMYVTFAELSLSQALPGLPNLFLILIGGLVESLCIPCKLSSCLAFICLLHFIS